MRLHAVLVLAAGLVLAADAPKDTAKKDLDKFQGTWTVVSVENSGQEMPADAVKELRLVIKGNERMMKMGDEVRARSTFKLDPSKSPKEIDLTLQEGDMKGMTFKGIYEIDGDTQKVCLNIEGGDRPKDFSSKEGSGHLLQVFKREKK
jgi:uncharacterized protein (TIGR03067 family)